MINAIVATDERLGIGSNNKMPWPHNKDDMKWFREKTNGGIVVMGRRTWESIGKKNLSNRLNVVVSTRELGELNSSIERSTRPHWIMGGPMETILSDCESFYPDKQVWVIGGAEIFRQAFPFVHTLYHTIIPGKYACDTFLNKKQVDAFDSLIYEDITKEGISFKILGKYARRRD